MICSISYAYDFEVDGLCYDIISNNEVEITYKNKEGGSYSGDLQIPEKVSYNNVEYTVTSIGGWAFFKCSDLTGSINIPNSVTDIGYEAFMDCSGLTGSIHIPNSVIYIAFHAFCGCSGLTGSLNIPNSVTYVGPEAFKNCSGLTGSLTIPNSLTKIEVGAFSGCMGLSSLTIPNTVTTIEHHAFSFCRGLTGSLIIPNSVTSIEHHAFSDCDGLTSVTIPNSVTSIGYCAFSGCPNLERVYSYILNPFPIGQASFFSIANDAILHIPEGSKSLYQQYIEWTQYFSKIVDDLQNPKITYNLSIKATGNGSASYSGETIRGKTKTYTVNEGTSVTISFTPDDGYRIKSLKVNGSSVTANSNYTTTINADTSIEVVFEEIPATTYTLSIKATGNGSASYSGETIRGKTKSYTVNEGTSVTISFTPDNGYRIKSLKVNGSSVTATSSYNTTINADTSIEVEFEEIPDIPTTYSLTIKATGNGSALYGGETIRNTKKSYTVDEGTSVTIIFSPDDGYRIKSLKVNNVDATVSDSYTTKVNADTKVEVEFEEVPVTTYSLSIKAVGKGSATYKNTTIRDNSQTFTVNEGSDVTIAFTPDDGYRIKMVKHDEADVTPNMIDNSYTISDIHADATVEVEFKERVNSFTEDGISYQVTSWEAHSLTVVAAEDGLTIEIPEKISSLDEEWTVTGIDGNVLDDHEILAAIIWNPEAPFTAKVANPNLLLYVKDEQYAPATIKNVVVNGYANSITLSDAPSGNNFYCPRAFTVGSITYSHRYWMKTGINESRGWETIALPFDVQKISHSTKGEITPFANWQNGDATYPFWLYQLSANGFIETDAIKANKPYIISMPNNDRYSTEYHLSGRVDFSAENVEVKQSDDIRASAYGDRTFIPNFVEQGKDAGNFALNVNNEYEVYQGEEAEGSKFVLNLRQIHPFEAYMTSTSNTRSIGVFDDMATDIKGIEILDSENTIKVYDLSGKLLKVGTSLEEMKQRLPAGVYIVNHQKMIIK